MDDAGLFNHRLAEVHYPAELSSVPAARHWLVDFFDRDVAPETVKVAALLTSELVTNAVVHTLSGFALGAERTHGGLRVEVHDASTAPPVLAPREPFGAGAGGRGLRIIDELSSRWGVEAATAGKTVWFELDEP